MREMLNMNKLDQQYMLRALDLAKQAWGQVAPNPYVGAILVKNGHIIGEGYHQRAGTPHAEIHALTQAAEQAQGATLYVTLEPCHHHGRTGPCTTAIVKAGVTRVISAMQDPNPLVSGKGHAYLQAAGIEVICGMCEQEARWLNRIFIYQHQNNTTHPYVILKAAMSLDGKLATQTQDAQWITTAAARKKAHILRQQCDAILIGHGTLVADNPRLTARHTHHLNQKQPIRIVLLSSLNQLTEDLFIFNTQLASTWLVFPHSMLIPTGWIDFFDQHHIKLIRIDSKHAQLDIGVILTTLKELGILSLLIEGGPIVHNHFLSAQCVNELALFYGPCLIGNHQAPGLWHNSPITDLSTAPKVNIKSVEQLDQNIWVTGLIHYHSNGDTTCLLD